MSDDRENSKPTGIKGLAIITHQEAIRAVADGAARETIRWFSKKADQSGGDFADALFARFLETLIYKVIWQELKNAADSKNSKQVKFELAKHNFMEAKTRIADAVAGAFARAMSEFGNRPVDYFCRLDIVPEPKNKEPC